jgi:hypothetical protein
MIVLSSYVPCVLRLIRRVCFMPWSKSCKNSKTSKFSSKNSVVTKNSVKQKLAEKNPPFFFRKIIYCLIELLSNFCKFSSTLSDVIKVQSGLLHSMKQTLFRSGLSFGFNGNISNTVRIITRREFSYNFCTFCRLTPCTWVVLLKRAQSQRVIKGSVAM